MVNISALVVEPVNHLGFLQPLGNAGGVFVVCLEGVYQPQPHQVAHAHLQWHGAAVGLAAVAHAGAVARPGFGPVDINGVYG
jgi:hypothetical protein